MNLRALLPLLTACGFSVETTPSPAEPSPDATAVFEVAQCPVEYTMTIGGSRYRIGEVIDYRVAHADCKDDTATWTHLVVIDTAAEADALRTAVDQDYFVGAVQQPGLGSATQGWFAITGGTVLDVWSSDEPDDASDVKNVARFTSDGLHDEDAKQSMRVICECDGRAIDPTIEGYIP